MGFQMVSAPSALPGCCLFCNSADRSLFADCEMNIDFHGAVYICEECIKELAYKIGYISPDQNLEYQQTIANMQTEIDLLKADLGNKTVLIEALKVDNEHNARQSASSSDNSSDSPSSVDDSSSDDGAEKSKKRVATGKGKSTKSSTDEDVAGLRSGGGSTNSLLGV